MKALATGKLLPRVNLFSDSHNVFFFFRSGIFDRIFFTCRSLHHLRDLYRDVSANPELSVRRWSGAQVIENRGMQ